MKYKLNEIFYSIQGEGRYTGYPAIFIRFSGCNLNCEFCDTDHSFLYELDEDEILDTLDIYKCKRVILTGGEPSLQLTTKLLKKLKDKDYVVHIETNGTQSLNDFERYLDWITVSPKYRIVVNRVDELKLVFQNQNLDEYKIIKGLKYLQPESMKNISETIQKVKENPEWNLSIQTQKLLKIR